MQNNYFYIFNACSGFHLVKSLGFEIKYFPDKSYLPFVYLLKTFGTKSWRNHYSLGGSGILKSSSEVGHVAVQLKDEHSAWVSVPELGLEVKLSNYAQMCS